MATPSQSKIMRPPTEQQLKGRHGEDQALSFLQHNGLTLVERNFRCKAGELDLVMLDHGVLVFVEVRKRNNPLYGGAAASVTAAKQVKLRSAAQVFLQSYASLPECRFDVLALNADQVDWLKNAIET